MSDAIRTLVRLRRRIMGQRFLERLAICALVSGGGLVIRASVNTVYGISHAQTGMAVLCAACVALAAAFAWTWSGQPTLEETAVRIDTAAGTQDRFLTAYGFSKLASRTPLESVAMEECARFIAAFDVRSVTRFRVPRVLPWLLVPVTALCLLTLHANSNRKLAGAEPEKDPIAERQSRELDKIAEAISGQKSDDLKKIADEIRKSEKRIHEAPKSDAAKATLHEMSSLENLIQEMLKSQKKASAEEIAALAAALKQSELTREAGSALEAGNAEQAAQKLEQLLKQQKDDPRLDKAGQDARQALSHLGENQKGQLNKELQRQEQSAGDGRKNAGSQALQRLAEMLRKSGAQQQQQGDSEGSKSSEAMQNALSQLQNLKYAGQGSQQGTDSRQGDPALKMLVPSAAPSDAKGQSSMLVTTGAPSGTHGDRDDTGTTKDPTGPSQKKSDTAGNQQQLNGVSGDGQSLQEFMTATGDHSQSNIRYRELYNAMLPAAEDAITQENIPPGSRFYIKRYFQSIRPKE